MNFETGEVVSNRSHPGREATRIHTGDNTPVSQAAKDDADIKVIVKRMVRTGQLPTAARVPTAGDFSEQVTDYHTAMNMVREADVQFSRLPAAIRSRFANDPQYLMDFLSDPQNNEESYKLGLRVRPVVIPATDKPIPEAPAVVSPGT